MDDKFPPLNLPLRPEAWAYRMPQAFLGACSNPLDDANTTLALERRPESPQPHRPFWTASRSRNSRAVDTVDRSTNQPNRAELADVSDSIPAAGLGNNRTIEQQFVSKQCPRGLAQAAWRWIY